MKKKNLILIILGCLFSFGIGVGFMGFLSKETPFKNLIFTQKLYPSDTREKNYLLTPKGWAVQIKGVTGPLQKCRLIQNNWVSISYQCFNPHTGTDDFFTYQILGERAPLVPSFNPHSCLIKLEVKNKSGELQYTDFYTTYSLPPCGDLKGTLQKPSHLNTSDYLFLRTSPRSSVLKGEALPSFQNPIFYEPMQGDRLANFFTFHLTPMTWESQDGQINDTCSLIEDGYTYVKLKCLFTTPKGKKESLIYTFYDVGLSPFFSACEIILKKVNLDNQTTFSLFYTDSKNCSFPRPSPREITEPKF